MLVSNHLWIQKNLPFLIVLHSGNIISNCFPPPSTNDRFWMGNPRDCFHDDGNSNGPNPVRQNERGTVRKSSVFRHYRVARNPICFICILVLLRFSSPVHPILLYSALQHRTQHHNARLGLLSSSPCQRRHFSRPSGKSQSSSFFYKGGARAAESRGKWRLTKRFFFSLSSFSAISPIKPVRSTPSPHVYSSPRPWPSPGSQSTPSRASSSSASSTAFSLVPSSPSPATSSRQPCVHTWASWACASAWWPYLMPWVSWSEILSPALCFDAAGLRFRCFVVPWWEFRLFVRSLRDSRKLGRGWGRDVDFFGVCW